MPPYKQYEPLPVTNYEGIPKELFNTPPVDYQQKYNQALQAKQALEAQQLNNQAVQLSVEARQRQAAYEKAQAEALSAQFGGLNPQEFDADKALQTAQRIAIQSGDLDNALAIEKATRDRANSDYLLVGEEAKRLGVPEGTPLSVARTLQRQQEITDINTRFSDPAREKSRIYGAERARQVVEGDTRSQLPVAERGKLQSAEGAKASINKVLTLLPELDIGALNALKSGKVTDLYKDPGSVAYRTYANLSLLKKQVARMNDSGALTELDVEMFAPLTEGSPVYDDPQSLAMRMSDLMEYIDTKVESVLSTNEKAGANVKAFRTGQVPAPVPNYEELSAPVERLAGQPNPQSTPSGPPVPQGLTPEEQAYKEQHKAKLRAQRGL